MFECIGTAVPKKIQKLDVEMAVTPFPYLLVQDTYIAMQ